MGWYEENGETWYTSSDGITYRYDHVTDELVSGLDAASHERRRYRMTIRLQRCQNATSSYVSAM